VIIKSLLDNDQYKFTMQQFVLRRFPNASVEYDLQIRTKDADLAPLAEEIRAEIDALEGLTLTSEEKSFLLEKCPYLQRDYINFLKSFKLRPKDVVHSGVGRDGKFYLTIKGTWVDTILFEVPILAIISEVWSKSSQAVRSGIPALTITEKIDMIQKEAPDMFLLEFGTRRRYSFDEQFEVIREMKERIPQVLKGTSNMLIAMKLGIPAGGTMAHEMFQCAQALYPMVSHHEDLMQAWYDEFHPYLLCALSDTLGRKYFLTTFNGELANLYDGTRQDSGNPFAYGDAIVNHYRRLGIDPKSKYVVFSDSLDIPKAVNLHKAYKETIGVRFGIGTNLTNDVGIVPLSIVIKVQMCEGVPVVKISDSTGKTMCRDDNYRKFMYDFIGRRVNRGY
jgi:nicotinate phosphoribosyltransferase